MTRILVAEDDEPTAQMLQMALEHAGCCVEIARNGREALEKIRTGDYEAIVSDQNMPGLTGEQLAVVVHRTERGTPLVLVSGEPFDEDYPLPEGVVARFQKPLTSAELLGAINDALGKSPRT
jgi:CheY-like chemotaxis protein